jgi:hypothetical protein
VSNLGFGFRFVSNLGLGFRGEDAQLDEVQKALKASDMWGLWVRGFTLEVQNTFRE